MKSLHQPIRASKLLLCCCAILGLDTPSKASEEDANKGLDTSSFERIDGFLTLLKDRKNSKLYIELREFNTPFIYVCSMASGIGSSKVGLDRGQMPWDDSRVVEFRRNEERILLVQLNYEFLAGGEDPELRSSVKASFAESVLASFEVKRQAGDDAVLIDATSFLLKDWFGALASLNEHGSYKLSKEASILDLSDQNTNSFPRNSEVETLLTFSGTPNSDSVLGTGIVPDPNIISLRQHHSFVKMPEAGYRPRRFEPKCGYFSVGFRDFAQPLGNSLEQRYILRHHIDRQGKEPLVYYVDRSAPAEVRRHLLEGARWWKKAFEEVGLEDSFEVRVLPENANPLDIRYNVILWDPRSARGWSYARWIANPLTGEIIKGQVVLDALRVRHLFRVLEGVTSPYDDGSTVSASEIKNIVYARLRQLVAHEVGHTLGLRHNFAGSSEGRSSVMDYPGPVFEVKDERFVKLESAYASGVGKWDTFAIKYGYSTFEDPEQEREGLDRLLSRVDRARGLSYKTDEDAPGWYRGINPTAQRWDNGGDPIKELEKSIRVRALALANFGTGSIPPGTPMAELERRFVPVYLLHRYQAEAVAALIGGMYYSHTAAGEPPRPNRLVPNDRQVQAFQALLSTIAPEFLVVSDEVLRQIPPVPPSYEPDEELFGSRIGRSFDPLRAAEGAAELTIRLLFEEERCNRLVLHRAQRGGGFGLVELVDEVCQAVWSTGDLKTQRHFEVRRLVRSIVLDQLMTLYTSDTASPQVRALCLNRLVRLQVDLKKKSRNTDDVREKSNLAFAAEQIETFRRNPKLFTPRKTVQYPPGSPIGCGCAVCAH